jgi:hypothetical protein
VTVVYGLNVPYSSLASSLDTRCVIINVCIVRVALRNVVFGSIMTAEWLSSQRN